MKIAADNSCQRCGTCCEKGGPSLHREDRPLVDDGRIPARCLFTIRRGELARDNVKGTLAPLTEEIIKIKGQAGRWTCLFYDEETRECGIYDHRPLECRAMDCRDTRRIERVYETARLTRRDLLSGIDGLWELIEDHEQRCSYDGLKSLVGEGTGHGRLRQEEAILEIIRYDAHVRRLTTEKGGMDGKMMHFIFGRPLVDTIKMFDIALMKQDGTYRLVRQLSFSKT
ncbi:MAG: YkgJ family cysteine cluster protein [Desulfosarcina sp.]|nr:YkgJ family cysteine cluster protein [Desulfosarcina sp.]MBC2741742.1 YkgJ family cysteine cluster protein [Desulfosarcina sp.]MBC2764656.1 YkgJ family cysteine cluster protein [Desulfosarcina sp.]